MGSLHQEPLVLNFVMGEESHKSGKFGRNFIHSVLSDICILDTYFVIDVDTVTMLCRKGDVEANDSFRRQFTPSCSLQNVV